MTGALLPYRRHSPVHSSMSVRMAMYSLLESCDAQVCASRPQVHLRAPSIAHDKMPGYSDFSFSGNRSSQRVPVNRWLNGISTMRRTIAWSSPFEPWLEVASQHVFMGDVERIHRRACTVLSALHRQSVARPYRQLPCASSAQFAAHVAHPATPGLTTAGCHTENVKTAWCSRRGERKAELAQ